MTTELKATALGVLAICAMILCVVAYNFKTHNDKMDAYYICLEKQEKIIKQTKDDKWSSTNLYCSTR